MDDNNYPEPKLPFKLTAAAIDERGVRRRAGETVYIEPSRRGPHHATIEGVEYPAGMAEAPTHDHEVILADEGAHQVEMLVEHMAAMEHKIDALHTKLDHLMGEMRIPVRGEPLPPLPEDTPKNEAANDG